MLMSLHFGHRLCRAMVRYIAPYIKSGGRCQVRSISAFNAVRSGHHRQQPILHVLPPSEQPNQHYHMDTKDLKLRRVVLLCKVTRYEYEKHLHADLTEQQLETHLTEKGSDYKSLRERYDEYMTQVDKILEIFKKFDIEVHCVHKFDYAEQLVDWADAIFTAGGDGTFLMAANKVKGHGKPVIGINTDPERSEGYLCLSKHYSTHLEEALKKITSGNFKWMWRQRICVTMSGKYHIDDSVNLHQQQMLFPEHRSLEHVQENEMFNNNTLKEQPPRELPILALNEVFIGESLSARVSFYHLSVDGQTPQRQKSSGITVCTGTGSTSWFFNINHLSQQSVKDILQIAQSHYNSPSNSVPTDDELTKMRDQFNSSLRFDHSDPRMAFCIRDPVFNGVFQVEQPRGFCKSLTVLSRMWDGWVVIDGSMSFRFNDGAIATLTTREQDALRCVDLE